MSELLTSPFFKFFLVPLGTVFLTVFVKAVSKNDKYSKFTKEDWAVGLQIAVGAAIAFTTNTVVVAQRLSTIEDKSSADFLALQAQFLAVPWIIVVLIIGLWAMSTLIRKRGWKSDSELTWFCGVIIPLLYGVLTLVFVVRWIGG